MCLSKLIKHHAVKTMTSAVVGGEWSASLHGRFTPGKIARGTHWIGGWVTWRWEKSCLYRDWNSVPSAAQTVASRYDDWATRLQYMKYVLY
jgi:hypothetical protein